jgi:hypothetical protein
MPFPKGAKQLHPNFCLSPYNTRTQYSTQQNEDHAIIKKAHGNNSRVNDQNSTNMQRRMQEGTSPPKWTKRTTQKVYVGHLHHYLKSVPMIWDPETKLISPQFNVMFYDNFDTVQPRDPNIKISNTMDRLFKINNYKYNDPLGNEHTYTFSYGGADIHPDTLPPNIKTCQESITASPTGDETNSVASEKASDENTMNNRSILRINDLFILHANNVFPQNSKDDFKG